jgi:hypothetical protein
MISSRARRLSTVAAIVCAGAFGALATPAAAFHIPGATYTGNHSAGGTMSFTVTADGSGLSNFNVVGPIPGNTCTFSGSGTTYVQPLPIVNHAFNDTTPPLTASGSFNARQSATGTFRIQQSGPPVSCTTPTFTWNATTTASPAGSEECKSAQAAVDAAEQKVKKAKKKVKKADDEQEKKKAKKKLKKAKAELQAAQAQAAAVCR